MTIPVKYGAIPVIIEILEVHRVVPLELKLGDSQVHVEDFIDGIVAGVHFSLVPAYYLAVSVRKKLDEMHSESFWKLRLVTYLSDIAPRRRGPLMNKWGRWGSEIVLGNGLSSNSSKTTSWAFAPEKSVENPHVLVNSG